MNPNMKPMMEQGEPAGDPTTPDNTPAHENAEPASLENQEGSEEDQGGGSSNVTPQEQAIYDTVVKAALDMIYTNGNSFQQILAKIKGEAQGQGLAFAIGHTAAMIMRSIVTGARQQGKDVPQDILLPAGQEVVSELVDVCVRAGLAKPSDEEQLNAEATMNGVQEYGKAQQNAGELTPDDQAQAQQEFSQLQQGGQPQPDQSGSVVAAAKGA